MEERIVIAVEEEKLRMQLACSFLRHGRNEIELFSRAENITDAAAIDWLITDEPRIGSKLPEFVGELFVIGQEKMREASEGIFLDVQLGADALYEIMDEWMQKIKVDRIYEKENQPARLIVTSSPVGGCGKTESSILLCRKLAEQGKKVLYLNLEAVQDFYFFLEKKDHIFLETTEQLDSEVCSPDELLQSFIGEEQFFFIKPLAKEAENEEKLIDGYISLIRKFRKENQYDTIVAEMPCKKYLHTEILMAEAEQILIFVRQDKISAEKLRKMEQEQKMHLEKYLYICDLYEESRKNYLEDVDITEYVPYLEHESTADLLEQGCLNLTAEILR